MRQVAGHPLHKGFFGIPSATHAGSQPDPATFAVHTLPLYPLVPETSAYGTKEDPDFLRVLLQRL